MFLQNKDINFKTWVCAQLKSQLFQQDIHIYYETDLVDSIYFLSDGAAGFVVPIFRNVVFVELDEGDSFGESDIIQSCLDEDIPLMDMIAGEGMPKRSFTVQALVNCEVLAMSLPILYRMSKEFYADFAQIFTVADVKLKMLRLQQLRCIRKCKNGGNIKTYDQITLGKFARHSNSMRESQ